MRRLAIVAGAAAALAAVAAVVERTLIAAPSYRGPRTDHFDGRRFHNHQSGWQTEGSFLKWQLTDRVIGDGASFLPSLIRFKTWQSRSPLLARPGMERNRSGWQGIVSAGHPIRPVIA